MAEHLPAAPDPRALMRMTEQIVNVLTGGEGLSIADEFSWLYTSGYSRPKGETQERTRRNVGGVSGTLADGFDELDSVRHHLRVAAAGVQTALDALRGSRAALSRAQAAVEGQARHLAELVASDPLPPSPPDRRELAELHAAQSRRSERSTTPWSSQEESFG